MSTLYSLLAALLVSLISLVGVITLSLNRKFIQKITLHLVSLSVGALFGGVFFHLLPELGENGLSLVSSSTIALGILLFFILEKFICWRHCHHQTDPDHPHPLAITNFIGDSLHNFLDGLMIAAAFSTNTTLGVSTTLAIILHEIPQEIGDFGIFLYAGYSVPRALFLNLLSALFSLLGVLVFFILKQNTAHLESFILPLLIGSFLYIAGSDLIPELKKETLPKRNFTQFLFICLGLLLMFLLS
jgi:zinc and cadmium transporter